MLKKYSFFSILCLFGSQTGFAQTCPQLNLEDLKTLQQGTLAQVTSAKASKESSTWVIEDQDRDILTSFVGEASESDSHYAINSPTSLNGRCGYILLSWTGFHTNETRTAHILLKQIKEEP